MSAVHVGPVLLAWLVTPSVQAELERVPVARALGKPRAKNRTVGS